MEILFVLYAVLACILTAVATPSFIRKCLLAVQYYGVRWYVVVTMIWVYIVYALFSPVIFCVTLYVTYRVRKAWGWNIPEGGGE